MGDTRVNAGAITMVNENKKKHVGGLNLHEMAIKNRVQMLWHFY